MEYEAALLNDIAYFMNRIMYLKLEGDIKDFRVYPDGDAEAGTFTLWITYNDDKRREYRTSRVEELMEIFARIIKEML